MSRLPPDMNESKKGILSVIWMGFLGVRFRVERGVPTPPPLLGNRKYLRLNLPNIWRLGRVRDTKLSANIYNKILLKVVKYHGYSVYRFGLGVNEFIFLVKF